MDGPRALLRIGWARARLLWHTLAHLGPRTTGQVLLHSARRRRAAGTEWAERTPPGPALEPGRLEETVPTGSGARFRFERAELEVALLADDVARLTWFPGELLPYAAEAPGGWQAPAVSLRPGEAGTAVVGGQWEVAVGSGGEVRVSWGGALVRRELAPRRRGDWWELRFRPRPGERWSGLGEQASGIELGAGRYRLWNRDPGGAWGPGRVPLYMGIPVLLCRCGDEALLSFYDNPSSCDVVLPHPPCAEGASEAAAGGPGATEVSLRFTGGAVPQYLITGGPPACSSVTPSSPAAPPCRPGGRSATTRAGGATAARHRCGRCSRGSGPWACRSAPSTSTSTTWTATGCSAWTAAASPTWPGWPPRPWPRACAS